MIFSVSLHFQGGVRFALLAMSLKKLTGDSSRWKRGMRSGVIGSLKGGSRMQQEDLEKEDVEEGEFGGRGVKDARGGGGGGASG